MDGRSLAWALALLLLPFPAEAGFPDGGADAGSDGGADAGEPDAGDGCRDDGDCLAGTRCIDGLCGVCGLGDSRPCNEGCGPGTKDCSYATRSWGRCVPEEEVECLVGDRRECDHECGEGYYPCDPSRCEFEPVCLSVTPIQCLPGSAPACVTNPNQCEGLRPCRDDCTFGECQGDPEIPCCGNGVTDPGEDCDGQEQCDPSDCTWTEARPFRSCVSCRTPGRGAANAPAVMLLAGAAAWILRRRLR